MKNLKLIVLFLLVTFCVTAQNYSTDDAKKKAQETLVYMNSFKNNVAGLIATNSVYIQQQGNNNVADAVLNSSDSEVEINQFGNENEVDLNVTALQIRAQINQTGNKNIFTDYSFAPQGNYNAQINQNGNNQKVYVSGSNSLSKNIKINVTGNNKTIFVNNYQ